MRRLTMILKLPLCLTIAFSLLLHAADPRGMKVVVRDKSGRQVGLYENSYALVIGVSDYTNGWPDLPGVKKDIEAVSGVLEKHGFNVTVIEPPDFVTLRQVFDDFINRYGRKSNDRLLFYFAGHGHTLRKGYGGEMGYIVPADAPIPDMDLNGFLTKALDMQMIEVYARRIDSKHALFLFDSCFSGSIFGITRATPKNITDKTSKPVRQFITSGSAGEEVPDRSIFRQQFVEALNGEADTLEDGYVTGTELGEFLNAKVVNYSKGSQHPQYGKIRDPLLDKGDFVFQLPKPERKPISLAKPSESSFSLTDLIDQSEAVVRQSKIGKDGAEMMRIPAGEFQMGRKDDDEKPVHTVYLDAFYMDKYEVTNALYKKFMDAVGQPLSYWSDSNYNSDYNAPDQPVGVSWYDAKAYADWAGKRLPTEAEWEKAARGGLAGKKYPWGDSLTHDSANYSGTRGRDKWEYTAPVGSFAPNGYGLHDMAGNVFEWCADWYGRNFYRESPKRNPTGPSSGTYRVLRGGSWSISTSPYYLSVYNRVSYLPTLEINFIGFRCVE